MTKHVLPPNLPPRILRREAAAAYVGVCPNTFDEMVAAGTMPEPRILHLTCKGYDVRQLDAAVDALPSRGGRPAADHGGWTDAPQIASAR
jgi:hypothetical protein